MTDPIDLDPVTFRRLFERVGNLKTGFHSFAYSCNETIGKLTLKDKVVLDVGAGFGWQALYFASNMSPKTIVALDPDQGEGAEPECLRNLISVRTELQIPNVDAVRMDFARNGLRNETFDVIMALQSLHHMYVSRQPISDSMDLSEKYKHIFREFHRLLKPKGWLILWEIRPRCLWRYIPVVMTSIDWPFHQEPEEFVKLAEEAGFTDVKLDWYVPYRLKRLQFLKNEVGSWFTAARYHVYAQKA